MKNATRFTPVFGDVTLSSTFLCPAKYCFHLTKCLFGHFYMSTCCSGIMLHLQSTSVVFMFYCYLFYIFYFNWLIIVTFECHHILFWRLLQLTLQCGYLSIVEPDLQMFVIYTVQMAVLQSIIPYLLCHTINNLCREYTSSVEQHTSPSFLKMYSHIKVICWFGMFTVR